MKSHNLKSISRCFVWSLVIHFGLAAELVTGAENSEPAPVPAKDLDRAVSTLVVDLEKSRLLDKTLVVIVTEFGRPPEFDNGGGRGHQSRKASHDKDRLVPITDRS